MSGAIVVPGKMTRRGVPFQSTPPAAARLSVCTDIELAVVGNDARLRDIGGYAIRVMAAAGSPDPSTRHERGRTIPRAIDVK